MVTPQLMSVIINNQRPQYRVCLTFNYIYVDVKELYRNLLKENKNKFYLFFCVCVCGAKLSFMIPMSETI